METNFGIKPDKNEDMPCCPSPSKNDSKESYPHLCFRGKHVKLLEEMVGEKVDIDDTITVTATFKVTGIQKGGYEDSVDLDLISASGSETADTEEPAGEADAGDAEISKPAVKAAKAMAVEKE